MIVRKEFLVNVSELSGGFPLSYGWENPSGGTDGIEPDNLLEGRAMHGIVNIQAAGVPFDMALSIYFGQDALTSWAVRSELIGLSAVLRVYSDDTSFVDLPFAESNKSGLSTGHLTSGAHILWVESQYPEIATLWTTSAGQVRRMQVLVPETPLASRMRFTNFAQSTLGKAIATDDSELELAGGGSRFPTPQGDEVFSLIVVEGNKYEVMYCTARDGQRLVVERGQEGTSPQPFDVGAKVAHTVTAAFFTSMTGIEPGSDPF